MTAEIIKFKKEESRGFVAGTLVHTDKGLVAIDQLKVGDMVLSRPENDSDAPNEYKRVVNTSKLAEKTTMYYVSYGMFTTDDAPGDRYLFCTKDHSFWVKRYLYEEDDKGHDLFENIGWIPASEADGGESHHFETYNGHAAVIGQILSEGERRFYGFLDDSQIAIPSVFSSGSGPLFDFRSGRPIAIGGGGMRLRSLSDIENLAATEEQVIFSVSGDNPREQFYSSLIPSFSDYEDYVYNLKIEGYHTYFVGQAGIWVGDAKP
jgi:transcription-repair coupling factor (superfamily II helicase)